MIRDFDSTIIGVLIDWIIQEREVSFFRLDLILLSIVPTILWHTADVLTHFCLRDEWWLSLVVLP